MVPKALGILMVGALLVTGLALHLRDLHPLWAQGLFWGIPGGLICAISAVGIALWADRRGIQVKQALAAVVVGMLFRMAFLAGWTILAILWGEANALPYLAGFGSIYLLGQALEVWLLARLRDRAAAQAEEGGPLPEGT